MLVYDIYVDMWCGHTKGVSLWDFIYEYMCLWAYRCMYGVVVYFHGVCGCMDGWMCVCMDRWCGHVKGVVL